MFTPADIEQLIAIQQNVYNRFIYTSDQDQYGVEEEWADIPNELLTSGTIRGDCDDYARICMLKAQQAGYDARLIYCKVDGVGHLICEVADSEFCQAFYFDNCNSTLVNFRQIRSYNFILTSPWNPVRGEKRAWLQVDQRALQRRRIDLH